MPELPDVEPDKGNHRGCPYTRLRFLEVNFTLCEIIQDAQDIITRTGRENFIPGICPEKNGWNTIP